MSKEETEALKKELEALTKRVEALEARLVMPVVPYPCTWPTYTPQTPTYITHGCSCPVGTHYSCPNSACPRRGTYMTTSFQIGG